MDAGAERDRSIAAVSPAPWGGWHWGVLIAVGVVYAAFIVAQWSLAYIDFGDGNYMYIGRRIAEGAVVYRDILAPQPPCHLFVSALIWRVAWLLHLAEPIYAFRAFSLLLRLATGLLVARLAWRAWGRPGVAVAAFAIFVWLPIGTWWSLGYQSEPLETFLLVAAVLAAVRRTRGGDLAAGLLAGLATLTNATAWPFLGVLLIYLMFHVARQDPRRLGRILLPWAGLVGAVTVAMEIWTGGAFLRNVVLNQVGTYPPDWLGYSVGKIIGQGGNVVLHEGFFVCFALLGLGRLLRTSPLAPLERGALGWYLLATLGSIIYVTKGGTEDYIYSLADPAIALLAAGELAGWLAGWRGPRVEGAGARIAGADDFWLKLTLAGTLLLFATLLGGAFLWQVWQREPYELGPGGTDKVVHLIEHESHPGDLILAPPFYAVRADRRLWQDYSELFIWTMKYYNDVQPGGAGMAGEGWLKINAMANAIAARKMALVVLEMDQTGRLPEPMRALERSYVPLDGGWMGALEHYLYVTRNTRLGIFVPAPAGETPEQAARRAAAWESFRKDLEAVYGEKGARGRFASWF